MTRKTNLFHVSILGIVFFASQAFAQPQQATLSVLAVDVSAPIYLGQNEPTERKGPTLVDKFKKFFNNLTRDGDLTASDSPQEPVRQTLSAVPTKPPKAPSSAEIKQAVENPDQTRITPDRRSITTNSGTEKSRQTTMSSANSALNRKPNFYADSELSDAEQDSIFLRMEKMRTQVFDTQNISYREPTPNPPAAPKSASPSPRTPRQTAAETTQTQQVLPQLPVSNTILTTDEQDDKTTITKTEKQSQPEPARVADNNSPSRLSNVSVESHAHRQAAPLQTRQTNQSAQAGNPIRKDQPQDSQIVEYQHARKLIANKSINTEAKTDLLSESAKTIDNIQENRTGDREKKLLVSPQLEVETEGDPRAIVGQEAVYRIKIVNKGGSPAEQVVLSVEIPTWLELAQPETSAGTTSVVPREENKDLRDFIWKVSRIEANANELLVLHLIPQQRKTVDLRIKYDYHRPPLITKITVQEPILEMELQGPDEVLWGSKVGYKLLVRNTGNGNADNVKLELLQTGSDMKSCELPVLKAGEEQVIDVDVWTGKQEHIDINIQATGMYDLAAKVNKRVKVMRPGIVMAVDSPTVQFVGNQAEFQIKVQNVGNAAARDLVLGAAIPLGSKFISCTNGGEVTQENQLVWKIDSILVGDIFTASVVCEPKREGTCKLETSIADRSGELASCTGSFEAEAIIELKLDVENPQGPVEVGQEAVYTINISNRGTKAAENVEVKTAFGKGLEPFAVEGGNAYMSDGQVVFDKIPTITAGQNLALKVKTKSDDTGSLKIRTEVVCVAANIHLVNENSTYFYPKQRGKSTTVVSSISSESTPIPAPAQTSQVDDPFLK